MKKGPLSTDKIVTEYNDYLASDEYPWRATLVGTEFSGIGCSEEEAIASLHEDIADNKRQATKALAEAQEHLNEVAAAEAIITGFNEQRARTARVRRSTS